MEPVQIGVYTHHDGEVYSVLGTIDDATNSRPGNSVVHYRSHRTGKPFVRDRSEFLEQVEKNDGFVPRFKFEPNQQELFVFTDWTSWVVAEDEEDASHILADQESIESIEVDWDCLDPTETMSIWVNKDGKICSVEDPNRAEKSLSLTMYEWTQRIGRGFLCDIDEEQDTSEED